MTLHVFPESLFIPIPHDNTSVFRPRSRSDVFHVPMTQNPYLSCLNVPIDSRLSITASFHTRVHLRSCSRASPPK
ncbi:unnamed protein product [Hymenolepis diminuta]|uniref:Uncharacterized protein n=1 Tax=Hymenolepis diminuta TaxID=6216 RepID=A0A564YK07_HYMDI|nr:unnamed protein product [Hymenolepis diminuta]